MKRMFVLLAVLGAVAAIVVPVSSAANNGAQVTHLGSFSSTDAWFGPVNCQGDNVYKTAPKPMNQDNENCTMQAGYNGIAPGVYSTTNGTYPGWNSDFTTGPSAGHTATSATVTITDNGNGTYNENIVANY